MAGGEPWPGEPEIPVGERRKELAVGRPFVIQLENRVGELAHVTRALATGGVNVEHVVGTSAGDKMCARIITDNDARTREVLRSLDLPFVEGDTLHVEVEDRPGSIADLAERLAAAGVNVTGILTVGHHEGRTQLAFTVDDDARAREVLGLPPAPVPAGVR